MYIGFFLVRNNAISKQGVDFEEHYAIQLKIVWSCGPCIKRHVVYFKTYLCHSVCILCLQTKLSTCP
jgi:hypothetical protein